MSSSIRACSSSESRELSGTLLMPALTHAKSTGTLARELLTSNANPCTTPDTERDECMRQSAAEFVHFRERHRSIAEDDGCSRSVLSRTTGDQISGYGHHGSVSSFEFGLFSNRPCRPAPAANGSSAAHTFGDDNGISCDTLGAQCFGKW